MNKKQRGFYYEVTQEQVNEHRKRSVKEIILWLQGINAFLKKVQTPEEKLRMESFRK